MPKVQKGFGHSVFYLYKKGARADQYIGPSGTGFFVRMETPHTRFYYGVTNHHVIRDGSTIIRINTYNGGARYMPFKLDDWHFIAAPKDASKPLDAPKPLDDVCAVPIYMSDNPRDIDFHLETDHYDSIPTNIFLTETAIEPEQIGLGENAFMIGLFAQHDGGRRNVPSARFGNLAMLADEAAPIENGYFRRPMHVIDMRSRTGFSGSPVFIYRTPQDDLTGIVVPKRDETPDRDNRNPETLLKLIGIHAGQFQDYIVAQKAKDVRKKTPEAAEAASTEEERMIFDGDKLEIPGAMTKVVPSWRISVLLDKDVFKKARDEAFEAMRKHEREQHQLGLKKWGLKPGI
jgi:hypothetical protein